MPNFDGLSVDSDAELVAVERVEALAIEASADVPFDNCSSRRKTISERAGEAFGDAVPFK